MHKISKMQSRIWGVQGGAGAGKTYSILWLIINHAANNPNKKIFIVSGELTKMKESVIYDFEQIMTTLGYFDKRSFPNRTKYNFPNGTFVKFIGLDVDDLGKGIRSDIVFFNEANKILSFEAYRQMAQRAKRVILDFNPDVYFWYHKEVMNRPDCEHLILTYEDNEYCPENEVKELLLYKDRGYGPDGQVVNEFYANKWRVYGLGEVGGVEGRIFHWKPCSLEKYYSIDKTIYYGVDWGAEDPFAIIEVKYDDGDLYVHELNYRSENSWRRNMTDIQLAEVGAREGEGFITWMFKRLKIPTRNKIICDNNRPLKIKALRKKGWTGAQAIKKGKGSVMTGVGFMQNLTIYYTNTSHNIEQEQLLYAMDVDRKGNPLDEPEDANNHAMDAIRYVVMFLEQRRIITAA